MSRISAASAYTLRSQCLSLQASGLGYKRIAAATGLSLGSVRNFLGSALPSVSPSDVIEAACTLKTSDVHCSLGPAAVLDLLAGQMGFSRDNPPVSSSTLTNVFRDRGIQRQHQNDRKGRKSPHWWLCEYDRPLRAFQIDTFKVVLHNGRQVEIFSCIDVVSRAMWMEVLPKGGSLVYCMMRCFLALGTPDMISSDNGQGMNNFSQQRLSDLVHFCFDWGVKTFHFIPVATPWFSGLVERLHRTIKRGSWLHAGRPNCHSDEDVLTWLDGAVKAYNTVFSHGSISGGKRQRVTPAVAHGSYTHLEPTHHRASYTTDRSRVVAGVVAYTRRASLMGSLRVDAPKWVFDLGADAPSAYGNFFRLRLDVSSGAGECFLVQETGEELIGTFKHTLRGSEPTEKITHHRDANSYVRVPVLLLGDLPCSALPFDELAELEREAKHLKAGAGARRPLDARFVYRQAVDCLEVVDTVTGAVVTTDEQEIVDHRSEILGDGW